jgi:GT2 family glycosyltransferase
VTLSTAVCYPLSLAEPVERRPVCDDLSVVIPTVGRDILETCLAHIVRGTHWPQEIIVVDQGRSPAVAAMLTRLTEHGLTATYIPSHERGRSAGLNRGLERVTTRFVAVTDDDCFVSPDWVVGLAERLRRDPATIWTGRVEATGDEPAISTVLSRTPRRHTRPSLRGQPFAGGNAGFAMALARRIGGFDEHPSLASAEDGDFGYRALRLGIPIAYDPDVVLYHYHWRDANQRAERYAEYARSQGGFYGKHLRRGDPLILAQVIRALVRSPLRWVRGVVTSDAELARNGRESTLNLLPGIIAGVRRADSSRAGPSPRAPGSTAPRSSDARRPRD